MKIRDVLFLEAYDGGSHQSFRVGLIARSGHRFTSHTLADRSWKLRLRTSASWFADRCNGQAGSPPDLIFATSMINIASLRGLLAPPLDRVPILLYMHENQLTYPVGPRDKFDFQLGFANIISAMAADRVVFNSGWHRDEFLAAIPAFLKRMPEGAPARVAERLAPRCDVVAVGLAREPFRPEHQSPWFGRGNEKTAAKPPVILWNHRWEHDKCPEVFVQAIRKLMALELPFSVALLGESEGRETVFAALREELGPRCVAFGHQSSREQYDGHLAEASIVVSCARQENFGISVAEAIHAGCYAVLPRGQVYPSMYAAHCAGRHFYDDADDLVSLLQDLLLHKLPAHECALDQVVDPYCWPRLAPKFDELMEIVISQGRQALPAP